MPRFWWVNHNQTAREEIEGRYLWSPKTESNGARSQFYGNMREASPGDLVLSYSGQAVRYVGRVADFAITAPKPKEFGNRGAYWDNVGWFLPVFWMPLTPPVRPKSILREIATMLPTKYSPIHRASGNGNQKAYLAAIPENLFDAVVAEAAFSSVSVTIGGANSLTFQAITEALDDEMEQRVAADMDLDDTTKASVIQARRGQGRFRANVETHGRACRLTGITNPTLLIASHIKPWRLCATAHERLDGMNGLMLTPDADLLFDRGFISFGDNGEVMVSPRVDGDDLRRLGFEALAFQRFGVAEAPAGWRVDRFDAAQHGYLDYHRSQVFVS